MFFLKALSGFTDSGSVSWRERESGKGMLEWKVY